MKLNLPITLAVIFNGPTHALFVSFYEESERRVGRISRNADLGHNVLHSMSDSGSTISLTCTCLKTKNRCQTFTIITNVN